MQFDEKENLKIKTMGNILSLNRFFFFLVNCYISFVRLNSLFFFKLKDHFLQFPIFSIQLLFRILFFKGGHIIKKQEDIFSYPKLIKKQGQIFFKKKYWLLLLLSHTITIYHLLFDCINNKRKRLYKVAYILQLESFFFY